MMNASRLAAAALVVASLCSSCIKKPELAGIDSGVKAETLDVQKAVARAWGNADPAVLMRKSDFVFLESMQTIQGNPPWLSSDEGQSVTERNRAVVSNHDVIHHKVLHQIREYKSDGTFNMSTESEDFDVTDTLPLTTASLDDLTGLSVVNARDLETHASRPDVRQSALERILRQNDGSVRQRDLSIDVASYLFNVCAIQSTEEAQIECYNLTTSSEVRPAPSLVSAQANCGGLPDCQMHVSNVDFDVLLTTKKDGETVKQKFSYHFSVTPDVPYLARVLDFCVSGLVKVPSGNQNIPVLVRTCKYVRNFNYGIPDTNL